MGLYLGGEVRGTVDEVNGCGRPECGGGAAAQARRSTYQCRRLWLELLTLKRDCPPKGRRESSPTNCAVIPAATTNFRRDWAQDSNSTRVMGPPIA